MINIKIAMPIIAGVTAAGVSVQKIINHRKVSKMAADLSEVIHNAVEDFRSKEAVAFNRAQDEITERMLAGYYDAMTDDEARRDYAVLYANFLTA